MEYLHANRSAIIVLLLVIGCDHIFLYRERAGSGKPCLLSNSLGTRQMPIIGMQKLSENFLIGKLIFNITCERESFSSNLLVRSMSSLPLKGDQRHIIKETKELMDDLWLSTRKNNTKGKNTSLLWLADLNGDSFLRGQYEVFEKYLVGNRSSPSDINTIRHQYKLYGSYQETYHSDRILCCEYEGECWLRFSRYNFNSSIHEEIQRISVHHNALICISWRWSPIPEDDRVLKFHLERHLSNNVYPRVVVVNHGLHCAFRCANPYDRQSACSESSMNSTSTLLNRIHQERGIFVVVDTAPLIRENITVSSCEPLMTVNQKVMQINNRMRNHLKNLRNSNIWVRDIEKWSYLFHANPLCVQGDGIHIRCNHFQEAHHSLLMNYVAGYLQLFSHDSLTYKQ